MSEKELISCQGQLALGIKQLEKVSINYEGKVIELLSALRRLPRSGTAIRMDKFKIDLPKQSILDHIVSLSYVADVLLNEYKGRIDMAGLANVFLWHDMGELIIGDVPEFTNQVLAGSSFLTPEQKKELEKKANDLIAGQLTEELAESFESAINIIEAEKQTELYVVFCMIDKMEPITSMWRYINVYRDGLDIEVFLEAMTDFFLNPNVVMFAINDDIKGMIDFLQNRENALAFYKVGDEVFDSLSSDKAKKYLVELVAPRGIS